MWESVVAEIPNPITTELKPHENIEAIIKQAKAYEPDAMKALGIEYLRAALDIHCDVKKSVFWKTHHDLDMPTMLVHAFYWFMKYLNDNPAEGYYWLGECALLREIATQFSGSYASRFFEVPKQEDPLCKSFRFQRDSLLYRFVYESLSSWELFEEAAKLGNPAAQLRLGAEALRRWLDEPVENKSYYKDAQKYLVAAAMGGEADAVRILFRALAELQPLTGRSS